jgi:hypothetical protein
MPAHAHMQGSPEAFSVRVGSDKDLTHGDPLSTCIAMMNISSVLEIHSHIAH